LHLADIEKLMEVIQRLVASGNTVLVIEHNLDVIKCADWVVDLGPEGGSGGGMLLGEGTPEHIAGLSSSYTGQFLSTVLASAGVSGPARPAPRARRTKKSTNTVV
jgi:excinuclease ABC subunit A